jgi:protein-tyrosine phosphatase
MIPDLYKIVHHAEGFLAIMPRPGPEEWLRDEIAGLGKLGVTTLVSLLEDWEERELSLSAESEIAKANGIDFISYPIVDRSVPSNLASFEELVKDLTQRINDGNGVAIHCRAGIGRSGITAASVLVQLGIDPKSVFEVIAKARRFPVPDTYEQMEWFEQNYSRFMVATKPG